MFTVLLFSSTSEMHVIPFYANSLSSLNKVSSNTLNLMKSGLVREKMVASKAKGSQIMILTKIFNEAVSLECLVPVEDYINLGRDIYHIMRAHLGKTYKAAASFILQSME